MTLLQMSLSGAFLIALVFAVRRLAFSRLTKRMLAALWGIPLARLLLPFTVPLPFVPPLPARTGIVLPGPGVAAGGVNPAPSGAAGAVPPPQNGVPLAAILPIVWAAGALVLAAVFFVSWLCCRREFAASFPVRNGFVREWLRAHPLRRPLQVRQLSGLSTPLAYGILRPVILLPLDTDWAQRAQLQYVLCHEYVHIRRLDAVRKLAAAAALCIHWFNPLVWAFYTVYNRDLELACDECVVHRLGRHERKKYALTLIQMEARRSAPAPFGVAFSRDAIEERIKTILRPAQKSRPVRAGVLAVAAAGALLAFAARPQKIDAGLAAVLRGDGSFLYVTQTGAEPRTLAEIPALFDPEDPLMAVQQFTVLDLDGDGEREAVLFICGMSGDNSGRLILHARQGAVYGYAMDARTLTELKTDGTAFYADPTGLREEGICAITGFDAAGYTLDAFTSARGDYTGWGSFVVERQPATEAEYQAARQEQAEKADAPWQDFAPESIVALAG